MKGCSLAIISCLLFNSFNNSLSNYIMLVGDLSTRCTVALVGVHLVHCSLPLLVFFTNKHVCFVATIELHLLTSFYNLLFMCIMFVGVLPTSFAQHQQRKELHLLTSFYNLLYMCIMFVGDLPTSFAQHQQRKGARA